MEFIIAIVFGALIGGLTQGTANMEDCKKFDFEPKSCKTSKILHDVKLKKE